MKTNENERKNKFYKTNPSGISLIVLVITIIVIIILATAIIVTLLSNNPINEANKARYENDRDSMQAIFTNTVAKVMAQKQGTMEIEASALNTVTSGVSSATGDANYTLNGVVKEEEKNGRIIFDNKENTETEYYTGKQLPIYKSGETTWYVDEEGIITLQVGDKIYGEGETEKLNKNIQIESKVTQSSDYVKATIEIEITYEGEIESITINGESIEIPEKQGGKYIISKEITENGEYKVEVKAKHGTKNKEIVKVEELTEDMEIWNRADMESFRDKVNSGRTYEGKTVKVMADIDLAGSQNNQWVAVNAFSGTFNGNYHKIKNLYINNNNNSLNGLFGSIEKTGKVEKVILDNCQISNTMSATEGLYIGGISARNYGIISQCKVLENSNFFGVQTFFSNNVYIGGIVGLNCNKIIECVNKSKITANQNTNNCWAVIGGIVASQIRSDNLIIPEVQYCYNTGSLMSNISGACLMGGIVGYNNSSNVKDCYQVGSINNSGGLHYNHVAAIIGNNEGGTAIENIYHLNSMTYAYNNCSGETIVSSIQKGSMSNQQMQSITLVNSLNRNNINKFVKVSNSYPILEWEQNS